jgi:C1A family cysteine protease
VFRAVSRHGFGMGWRPDGPTAKSARHLMFSDVALRRAAAVTSLDLERTPYSPPVYDQGQIGSCQSNAGEGLMQFVRRKQGALPDWCGSRLMTYYLVRKLEGTLGSDAGGTLHDVLRVLIASGVCPEDDWPYDDTSADPNTGLFPAGSRAVTQPSTKAFADARLHEATQAVRVHQDVLHMKATLVNGFPFMFGFAIFNTFFDDAGNPLTDIPLPGSRDEEDGGHAVCGWGFDDHRVMPGNLTGALKCRNSWGPHVQQNGYFWLPYAYVSSVELASDFWSVSKVSQ